MSVFEARGLTKRYKGRLIYIEERHLYFGKRGDDLTALDSLDLTLESGHIYGLVGNNGAGKTTLMRIIAGMAFPTAGSFRLLGAETEKELFSARQRIGCLISQPAGYEDLTLWQNLKAQELLLPEGKIGDLRELCALVGLDEQTRRRTLRKASTGEKQRYGLAAALLGDPELLILDEPMNGLDPSGVHDLRELLLELHRERGKTILISSHLLTELHEAATDFIFLRRGRLLETVTAEELDRRIAEEGHKNVEGYFLALNRRKEEEP